MSENATDQSVEAVEPRESIEVVDKGEAVKPEESKSSEQDVQENESADEDDFSDDEDDSSSRDAERLLSKLRKKNGENQKLRSRAIDAETRAEQAESKLMRYQVAAELNLPLHLAERLKGDSVEALKQDAEDFLQHIAPASVLGFAPDDGRRSGVAGETTTPSLSEIGARIYER